MVRLNKVLDWAILVFFVCITALCLVVYFNDVDQRSDYIPPPNIEVPDQDVRFPVEPAPSVVDTFV